MNKYEFVRKSKEVNGVVVMQIRALNDIPLHGIKAGDLGGWCNRKGLSQSGSCWICPDATLIDSTVTGDTLVEEGVLENSTVEAQKIACTWIKNSTIKGELVVIESRSFIENSIIETIGTVKMSGVSELHDCKIYASEVRVDASSRLSKVTLRGEKITITKKSAITGTSMNGVSIHIMDSEISQGTHLAGNNMLVQESEIQDFDVKGDDVVFSNTKMVKGKARGDRMTIKGETDIFNCHLEGKDILFDGDVKFHNSYIGGDDQRFEGILDIEWVYFYGDGMRLDGIVFLLGKEGDNTFQIKNKSKLDGIIHIEATYKDLAINGETLEGDFAFNC